MKLKQALGICLIVMLFFGCSKEEKEIEQTTQHIEGGQILNSELVRIKIENKSLQDQYNIIFEGYNLTILKIADNELVFQVPPGLTEGDKLFIIPKLDNYTILFNVKKPVLPDTPDNVMAPFFEEFQKTVTVFSTQDNDPLLGDYFSELQTFYSSLNTEEKQLMAEYYYVNKQYIDTITTTSLAAKDQNLEALEKFGESVIFMGAAVAIAILNPEIITKTIAVGVAIISFKRAYINYRDFSDNQIIILDYVIDELLSGKGSKRNSLTSKSELVFKNDKERVVETKKNSRALIATDSENQIGELSTFFSSFEVLNTTISSINEMISFVNKSIFSSSLGLIDEAQLPDNLESSPSNFTPELFNNTNFSVADQNISIASIQLTSENKLAIKLKIVNTDQMTESSIQTKLNFEFTDSFNQLEGSFPIKIETSKIELSGDLNFGTLFIKEEKILELAITNTGTVDFSITNNLIMPEGFIPTKLNTHLPAGTTQIVPILFYPQSAKDYNGIIILNDDTGKKLTEIAVTGKGVVNYYLGNWEAVSYQGEPLGTYLPYYGYEFCSTKPSHSYAETKMDISITKELITYSSISKEKIYNYESFPEGECPETLNNISEGVTDTKNASITELAFMVNGNLKATDKDGNIIEVQTFNNGQSMRSVSGLEGQYIWRRK